MIAFVNRGIFGNCFYFGKFTMLSRVSLSDFLSGAFATGVN